MTDLRVTRQTMPAGGWPAAPCHHFRVEHPAHGWIGGHSARIYWCGPAVCAAARLALTAPPGQQP